MTASRLRRDVSCVSVLLALFAVAAVAAPPGSWMTAASMSLGRSRHTATLMEDGRVLVVGGLVPAGSATPTVEIYDPETDVWSAAAPLPVPRSRHVALRLPDGRILVAGGRSPGAGSLPSAEVYDPRSDTWTPTGPMSDGHDNFAGVVLADGRVLVAGGVSFEGGPGQPVTKAVELYDPARNAWSRTDHMANARFGHGLTLLSDGRVLVTGGTNSSPDCAPLRTAETYDPVLGRWRNVSVMDMPRGFHGAVRLLDGSVLAVGGLGPPACETTAVTAAEIYRAGPDRWESTGGLAATRGAIQVSTALLDDGRVLVAGGRDPSLGTRFASAEVYDPATGVWSPAGSMAQARSGGTATVLADGRVLLVGGNGTGGPLATVEIYTP